MIGDMQKWTPNVAGIIEHAKKVHPKTEIISRLVSGEIHRSNYEEVCIRSRKLASVLEKDGYKEGDVLATLALNTYRHLEMYYGISGMGAITHTLNFRLHPEQAVYIINHAEDIHLCSGGLMNEGLVSAELGIPGNPDISESTMVYRDLSIAEYTGGKIHVPHVSSEKTVKIIKEFKQKGANVTAEVTPHHLVLTEEILKDYNTKKVPAKLHLLNLIL